MLNNRRKRKRIMTLWPLCGAVCDLLLNDHIKGERKSLIQTTSTEQN